MGESFQTYIIAEIGQNHNGSVLNAKKLIDMSKRCGVNAVKFQKRDIPSELTKEAFDKPYDNPNSFGKTYGEHRIFLELSEDNHRELKEYCDTIKTGQCLPPDQEYPPDLIPGQPYNQDPPPAGQGPSPGHYPGCYAENKYSTYCFDFDDNNSSPTFVNPYKIKITFTDISES